MGNEVKLLLEKTRRINRSIQQSSSYQMDFDSLSQVLSDVLVSSVFILSRRGKVLGSWIHPGLEPNLFEEDVQAHGRVPEAYNNALLQVEATLANEETDEICADSDVDCPFGDRILAVAPLMGGGERLGTLVLVKDESSFVDADLVLAEYGATVVGMEIVRSRGDKLEEEVRKKAACQIAIGTLSFSELEAVEHIFDELDEEEGLLVASKIADRAGITRSVIVNALRKLESASVIESRSLGMKGTYIRVLNEFFLEELAGHRSR